MESSFETGSATVLTPFFAGDILDQTTRRKRLYGKAAGLRIKVPQMAKQECLLHWLV